MEIFTARIIDPVGLHAAPAAELVNMVKEYNTKVTLIYNGREINLKSIVAVLSMGIPTKAEITICADGLNEERIIRNIKAEMKRLKMID